MNKQKEKKNKQIKALITGSSGFIGSHLTTALIEKGWDVYALVRKSTDTGWLEKQKVHLVQADYSDSASLKKAVAGMDYVFHVGAALKAPDFETFIKANAVSTKELAAACVEHNPKLKKFLYVSSMAAVGPSIPGVLKTEKDENTPTSLYGQSKMAGEEFLKNFADRLPYVIVRPPNVLGTGQQELKMVINFANKRVLPQLGNGDKQISIIFVADLVRALILAAESDKVSGEAYLVTDNRVHSWRDLIYAVAESLGKTPYVLKMPFPVLPLRDI